MRAAEKNGRFAKSGWKWLLLGVACLGLFALRHNIAGVGVNFLLRRAFSSERGATFAYSNVEWHGNTIVIDELNIVTPQYQMAVQRLEVVLDTSFSPSFVFPHIWVFRPYLIFQNASDNEQYSASTRTASLAAPLGLLDWLRLDVVEGRCEWTPREDTASEDLYFQMISRTRPDVLGTLELFATSDMDEEPLIRAELTERVEFEDRFVISWESNKLATQHLLPLLWTVTGHAITGWERIEGSWDLKGSVGINGRGEILDVHSSLAVTNLELRNAELGLHAAARHIVLDLQQLLADPVLSLHNETGQGIINKAPWYQRVEARAIIEEGEIACNAPLAEHPWGITRVDGRMVWCENEDPVFSLKGVTIQEGGEKELFVQGTGSLGNEQSFWLQTYLTWGAEEKPLLETTVSLCSQEPSSLVIEAQVNELQMNAAASLLSLFGLQQEELLRFHFDRGTVKGVVTAWLEKERLERIELRDVVYDKLNFYWIEKGKASGCSGTLEGSWRHHAAGWANNHLILSFHLDQFQPLFAKAPYSVVDIEGEGLIEGEQVTRAYIKGRLGEIPFHCTCEGGPGTYRVGLSSDTTLGACLKTFALASSLDLQTANEITLQARLEAIPDLKEGSRATGSIFVQNTTFLSKDKNSDPAKEIAIACFWPLNSGIFPQVRIHADALPAAIGLPFLKKILPETQCKGDFGLNGSLDDKGIELQIDIPRLHVTTSLIDVDLLPSQEKRARGKLSATWGSGDFRFLLPLIDARCTLPPFGITFSHVRALLELDKRHVLLKDLYANCEGIDLQGQIQINNQGVALRTDMIKGRFEDLETVFSKATHGKYERQGITGDFSSGTEGLLFEAPLDLRTYSIFMFQGAFSSAQLGFSSGASLQKMSGAVTFDSRQHCLKIARAQGVFATACGVGYTWAMQPTVFTENGKFWEGSLDAALSQEELEIMRWSGLLRFSPASVTFSADSRSTHLLGSMVEKANGTYYFPEKQWKFQGSMNWDLEQLPVLEELVCDLSLIKRETLPNNEIFKKPSSGLLDIDIDYDSSTSLFQFSADGKSLDLFGTHCPSLFCQGKNQGAQWKFLTCRWGDHRFQFDLQVKKNELEVPFFVAQIGAIECRGSAAYAMQKHEWQCQLQTINFDIGKQRLQCKSKQPLLIDCTDKNKCLVKGLVIEEVDSRSQLVCPVIQMDWENKAFQARNIQHRLSPPFIKRLLPPSLAEKVSISPKEILEGTLQIEGNWQERLTYQVQAGWKECLFQFGNKSLSISHLSARYREGAFLIGGKTVLGQLPVIASLQVDHQNETLGVFKIQESPQDNGLALFFHLHPNGSWEPSHIVGECSGIKTDLRKKQGSQAIHLQGTVEVDFTKVRQLFPRDTAPPWQSLQLGRGFVFGGDFIYQQEQFGFQGEVRGERCELLGCQMHGLQTALTWQPQRLKLEKLQLHDPALTLAVRKLLLEETVAGKVWTISCPTVQIRDFQPSRLHKLGKGAAPEKPFVIRNLTLTDLMGDLNNPKTFSGACSIHFTNGEKKDGSVFDIPLDFLKDLGLEPSLLVPIQGELEGHFQDGRLRFTALTGSYSEGRRTQFSLSDRGDGSYIDFQGNMHIDLAVKQAVLLKLAESLTLGIRGSVSKPLYILLP